MEREGSLKLGFATDSKVGKLWSDIEADYFKDNNCVTGKEKDECRRRLLEETHTGCVDSVVDVPIRKFVPDTVQACEVLERAYRFSDHHPLLIKHGFIPPPFSLDDDAVKKEIHGAVDGIRSRLLGEGMEPGSIAYQERLLKELYEWGIRTLDFEQVAHQKILTVVLL